MIDYIVNIKFFSNYKVCVRNAYTFNILTFLRNFDRPFIWKEMAL